MTKQLSLDHIQTLITGTCTQLFGSVGHITAFDSHASLKKYFKVDTPQGPVVASYLDDPIENSQFVRIANHLKASGVRAPVIYYSHESLIIQEYLGAHNVVEWFDQETVHLSKVESDKLLIHTMSAMVRLASDLHHTTDHASLGLSSFIDEYAERDINLFVKHWEAGHLAGELADILHDLKQIPQEWISFSHRDYQLRNIMTHHGDVTEPVLIDFQSALAGPVTYDLASLIFSSRYSFTEAEISTLVHEYIGYSLTVHKQSYDEQVFERFLYLTALIRVIQAISAYKRSMKVTGKNFASQISRGLKNLALVVDILKKRYDYQLPLMSEFLAHNNAHVGISKLPIIIKSFSYEREGLPRLNKRHINILLDLRTFSNPGRIPEYRELTGNDLATIEYLEQFPEINQLKTSLQGLLRAYFEGRYDFSAPIDQVSIYLGCNGGRHRSVYFAEAAYRYISEQIPNISSIKIHHPNISE